MCRCMFVGLCCETGGIHLMRLSVFLPPHRIQLLTKSQLDFHAHHVCDFSPPTTSVYKCAIPLNLNRTWPPAKNAQFILKMAGVCV
jgi:hypothetical protein